MRKKSILKTAIISATISGAVFGVGAIEKDDFTSSYIDLNQFSPLFLEKQCEETTVDRSFCSNKKPNSPNFFENIHPVLKLMHSKTEEYAKMVNDELKQTSKGTGIFLY